MALINETLKKRVSELEERIDYLYEENIEYKKKIENLNDKVLELMKDHILIIKDYYEIKNNIKRTNIIEKEEIDSVNENIVSSIKEQKEEQSIQRVRAAI